MAGRRRVIVDFETKPGRRDIWGAPRTRYKNHFQKKLKSDPVKQPDTLLEEIMNLPDVQNGGYLDAEPWALDVTARLADAYQSAADMPGSRSLMDIREERVAQAIAAGMRLLDALKHAGYTQAWSEILEQPKVLHRIAYHRRLAIDAAGVTIHRLVSELRAVAFGRIDKAVTWAGQEVTLKSSDTIDAETLVAIAEVRKNQFGIGIKFHDKLAATRLLMQWKGMLVEKHELSGPDGKPIETVTADMDPVKAAELYAELIKGEAA